MAKVLLLIALCVLPALVSATRTVKENKPLVVQGSVLCDRCRAGFETSNTRNLADAKVKLECADRKSGKVLYKREAYTDTTGKYKFDVFEDHSDELCEVALVKSSQPDCSQISPGRDRACVILTSYNGIASNVRYANAMHFMVDQPDARCTEIMKMYQEEDDKY